MDRGSGRRVEGVPAADADAFQHPFEALSARFTSGQVVREPLDLQEVGDADSRLDVVRRMVAECRLHADDAFLGRHTHDLSVVNSSGP